jgi:hypothetical protein
LDKYYIFLIFIIFSFGKKIFYFKNFFQINCFIINISFIINFIQIKIDLNTINSKNPKKHYLSIIDYTAIKFGYKFDYETGGVPQVSNLNFLQDNLINNEVKKSFITQNLDINYLFNSTPDRKLIYKKLINELSFDNILFGNGLNSINFKVIKPNTTNVILNIRNAESQIIQILFEIGLVGLLIYIIITILILNILSLNYKIILLSLISLNFFNSYQENIIFMVLFGSIVGIGANNKIK